MADTTDPPTKHDDSKNNQARGVHPLDTDPHPPRSQSTRPKTAARLLMPHYHGASSRPASRQIIRVGSQGSFESYTAEEERDFKMMIPTMHKCWAITCFVLNAMVPGLGTMVAGMSVFFCCTKTDLKFSQRIGSCCLNLGVGLAQLILAPVFLLGWVWSICWGIAMVGQSDEEYHATKITPEPRPKTVISHQPSAHGIAQSGRPKSSFAHSTTPSNDGQHHQDVYGGMGDVST
ncbi:uncharacterized protein LOC106160147 [Lingula anatina]|uniref:Uncharacterized protein LOC106160147 n=1 Tax=Lingula anatina TaxID=7574 RepID=A0A1S3I1J5_LINAN|nr:uncharacterized protein LOC106160147 [Lingula anatina]|eukprot:XP_013392118.2 uncharacterized protein LOC106160147 [Lingula anatina]